MQFEYLVMSFELYNTPNTFQNYINNLVREYLDMFYIAYLDNILIYSKNKKKNIEHILKIVIRQT